MHSAGMVVANVARALECFGTLSQEYCALMLAMGWPPQRDVEPKEMQWVVGLCISRGVNAARPEVEKWLLERHNRNGLNEMLTKREEKRWLGSRLPIVRQAVEPHLDGKYSLAIPVLLAQIEGMIPEACGHVGRHRREDIERYLKQLVDAGSRGNRSLFEEAIREFDDKVREFLWFAPSSETGGPAHLDGTPSCTGWIPSTARPRTR